jgi:Leucine-rich repeat (LRR) protein
LKLEASDPFLRQRYALATLFYSLGEPEELLTGEWLSGKPECEWEMLECDPRTSSSVRRLHLQGNEIRQLPKELAVLQYVTYLDLSANLLDGDVSQVIGDWSHLEELRLSSNNLQCMPTGLDWKALKHLDVSSNYIQGPLPESLVLAKGLVYLDIALNGFTGTVPSELGNLTSLGTFYMHGNSLEGSMPQAICDLRYGQLRLLSADCNPPNSPEVECACCSVCNDYDFDRNPFT